MAERRARQPYLDPEKGEDLPQKEVSSKAYARLSLAAEAIAATKRAIQHQGNQVPALKATNMNSEYRLEVMRDDRCWDYTPEAQAIAWENPEADAAARADLAHGGNCGEHATLAYHHLRHRAKGEHIQMCSRTGLDHAFVILGDLKKEKPNQLAVSDPWPNNPTACLWEDHFAFTEDRDQLEVDASQVADGKSFKKAIAAGLKLSKYGRKQVEKSESDKVTKEKTDDWKANHYWWHDNTTAQDAKYDYQPRQHARTSPATDTAASSATR
jgi:hypothetical protein